MTTSIEHGFGSYSGIANLEGIGEKRVTAAFEGDAIHAMRRPLIFG